jgi:hypothetical protein
MALRSREYWRAERRFSKWRRKRRVRGLVQSYTSAWQSIFKPGMAEQKNSTNASIVSYGVPPSLELLSGGYGGEKSSFPVD